MQVNDKVEAHEGVAVPAGTFMVCKVVVTDAFGAATQQWCVPSQGGRCRPGAPATGA